MELKGDGDKNKDAEKSIGKIESTRIAKLLQILLPKGVDRDPSEEKFYQFIIANFDKVVEFFQTEPGETLLPDLEKGVSKNTKATLERFMAIFSSENSPDTPVGLRLPVIDDLDRAFGNQELFDLAQKIVPAISGNECWFDFEEIQKDIKNCKKYLETLKAYLNTSHVKCQRDDKKLYLGDKNILEIVALRITTIQVALRDAQSAEDDLKLLSLFLPLVNELRSMCVMDIFPSLIKTEILNLITSFDAAGLNLMRLQHKEESAE